MVEEETLKRIRRVKQQKENNKRDKFLSRDECNVLIDSAEPHLKPILITALNTGMRKTEILTLTWDNVNLKKVQFWLKSPKTMSKEEIQLCEQLPDGSSWSGYHHLSRHSHPDYLQLRYGHLYTEQQIIQQGVSK